MSINPLNVTRRQFVVGSSVLASASWIPSFAHAATDGRKRLVFIILRGGQDGLHIVPPYGEPNYKVFRGPIAIPAPTGENTSLKLDGLFALHPKMKNLHQIYLEGNAIILHAIAPPYHERSHFTAQDILENGTDVRSTGDGWVGRALAARGANVKDRIEALSFSSIALPLSLYGAPSASVWNVQYFKPSQQLYARVLDTYSNDDLLHKNASFVRLLEDLGQVAPAEIRVSVPSNWPDAGKSVGQLMSHPMGPDVIVMNVDGWDFHGGQGAVDGNLADSLRQFDGLIGNMKAALGPYWSDTVVVAASEFGRTVRANGSWGTDHGVGGAAFIFGGAVKGGRVISDWPGLGEAQLFDGRDLKPTIETRAIFKGLLREHWGLDDGVLDTAVFPDSAAVKPLEGLIA